MGKANGFLMYNRVEPEALPPRIRVKNFNEFHIRVKQIMHGIAVLRETNIESQYISNLTDLVELLAIIEKFLCDDRNIRVLEEFQEKTQDGKEELKGISPLDNLCKDVLEKFIYIDSLTKSLINELVTIKLQKNDIMRLKVFDISSYL